MRELPPVVQNKAHLLARRLAYDAFSLIETSELERSCNGRVWPSESRQNRRQGGEQPYEETR